MIKRVVLPKLGLTATEGRIVEWFRPEGSNVVKGDPLFVVETEKANVEIECPADGILLRALPAGGGAIPVGEVIGFIATEGETSVPAELLASSTLAEGVKSPQTSPVLQPSTMNSASSQGSQLPEDVRGQEVKASPLARKLAAEKGVDLTRIAGTGPGGRITKEDVLAVAEAGSGSTLSAAVAPATNPSAATAAPESGDGLPVVSQAGGAISGQMVQPSRFNRVGAKRLAMSFSTIPHFYLRYEADAGQLLELRQHLLPLIEARNGNRLSITDMLVRAVALALKSHPLLNASYEDPLIRTYDEVNIAVAVDTPNGLAVPVVREADRKSLAEISSTLSVLAERAKTMKLTAEDVSGGTFTVSNLGMFGVESFSAIINPPQAGILAVGGIIKRPVVVRDTIAIRPMMSMTLSADHRVVDGAEGARFMKDFKELIENAYVLVA